MMVASKGPTATPEEMKEASKKMLRQAIIDLRNLKGNPHSAPQVTWSNVESVLKQYDETVCDLVDGMVVMSNVKCGCRRTAQTAFNQAKKRLGEVDQHGYQHAKLEGIIAALSLFVEIGGE